MFGDALTFPLRGDDGLRSVVIGGILSFPPVAVFVVPVVPVLGYFLRAAAAGVDGDSDAPAFDEWEGLFVDGILFVLVAVAYFLFPIVALSVVIAATGFGSAVAIETGSPEAVRSAVGVTGAAGIGLAALLFLVAAYVFPAAVVNFAYRDDIRAAFQFRRVLHVAISADYVAAGVIGVLLLLVVGIASLLLGALTFGLFFLLTSFVQFYARVGVFYLFGRGYGKALGLDSSRHAKGRA